MQNLSNGEQRVVVEGKNVRQIIESLDQKYPGFKDRLVEDGRVKPNISVAIDGEITPLGMIEKVSESIKFLMLEYERLIKKQKDGKLSKSELETLNSLKNFLGKN